MRTLIYKRTHSDDPDATGWFGICDCMGRVRAWPFDAVIGVGGTGAEPKRHGLNGKVNWIGIHPRKSGPADKRMRGPDVTFEHFLFFGCCGPSLKKLAPRFAARFYSDKKHFLMIDVNAMEPGEVGKILALAKRAPPSSADPAGRAATSEKCSPRTSPAKPVKGCSS